MAEEQDPGDRLDGDNQKNDKMFTLKKWNAVAMWSWDVECDTCAICRVQVMGELYSNSLALRYSVLFCFANFGLLNSILLTFLVKYRVYGSRVPFFMSITTDISTFGAIMCLCLYH